MTQRERYLQFIDNPDPKNLPLWGDWISAYDTFVAQGMPPAPDPAQRRPFMCDVFGHEGVYSCYWGTDRLPVDTGLMPLFSYELIEETDTHILYRGEDGNIVKEMREKHTSLRAQQYIEHPLKGSANWASFRDEHLQPDAPGRYPPDADWARLVAAAKARDHIVTIDGGSFYGVLRNWMGVENISYAMHDEPEWVEQAASELADFYIHVLTRAVRDIPDIDCALFWEDMCFKNGPLCSPAMFRRFFLQPYRKVTRFLREHGVRSFWVDCDGNIEQLIDLFIEGGVNGFYPLEVAAGMDAVALMRRYGRRIRCWGGIDKRELAKGREAIARELERVAPAVEMGGYIPLVDHGVPDDVGYENYRLYNEMRKKRFGLTALPRQ